MFPHVRMRRTRKTPWMRDLLAQTILVPENLVQPFFVIDGQNKSEAISSMPGVSKLSIDLLVQEVLTAEKLGIKAVALFPSVDSNLKNSAATEAYNENNLISRAVRAIKSATTSIGIICDVALDPYTDHGHDGIFELGDVNNDATLEMLQKQALVLVNSGADIIAPSDMMDGRVMVIREYLDENGFEHIPIISYAIKYSSTFYGPFREAMGSKISSSGVNKMTYQADFRSGVGHALREVELDVIEGADILMIKPAGFYLDIISHVVQAENIPVFAYQVSGEYSMIKFASEAGALRWKESIFESLIAIKRAGATAIFTYAAMEVAEMLQNQCLSRGNHAE
jgi:porphobilinogen synthase